MSLRRLLLKPSPSIERDTVLVQLPDQQLEVQRVRDPRAKRIKLSVDERGARLTLPLRASLVSGDRFLHEHRQWLALQLDKYAGDDNAAVLARNVTSELPLRGATLPLAWHEGRYSRLTRDEHGLHFHLPGRASDATLQRTLREFYEAEARADIGRWLPRYLPGLPRGPARLRLKVMSSQWGSLSPDGSLALDLALVLGRPSAFEYVLVHELCHLIHANHSPRFWHEVEARFPEWRDEREYFHAHGRGLKASLRALLATPSR
ncbi:M48 family peptidase [Pseudoxanthomonas gei]|uniref:M48 family peptidase n=1 Tax=Pseudoxanthomonas gei TaxID=1383030 RepID=A0ABX0AD17_9GAMM|nr:SprT family zinc-dependent metalloprotease [Pseudoxanthomonas gei]NDK39447.1 M48 family peptidase [Pseudoxanthomonas gei]